ncbi:MAG: TonB-dependent receptor [Cyclobacteriaceae bacterium]|jgi:hemoglobin/transferrin/lactoferrin receptor protein
MTKCYYLLLLFISPLMLRAQEAELDTTTYLSEVTVAANRWEQNLREISGRMTKLSKNEIRFQNPQTAADLLGFTNQVFIQKSQLGGGSPIIRGFATNRVMIVVDGVRMNNAIFRGGNVQNVISLDANAVREAEVVFGPGSVIYGSDAIGGVMDFHTLRPEFSTDGFQFSGNALARYSSANRENTGHLDFNIGLNKWAFTSSVTYSKYGDLQMGSRGPVEYTRPDYQVRDGANDIAVINPNPDVQVESGYNQLNIMQKIRFRPNERWDITYGFHNSETSNLPRYDRLILKNSSGVFTNAEWYYGPQKWTMHALSVSHRASSALFDQARLTAAYQDYSESRHNRNFSGPNRNRITERFENVKAFSVNLDLDKQISERTSLFYGAEFVTNDVNSVAQRRDIVTEAISPVSTRYPDGSVWRSLAAYASIRHKLNEQVILNASSRYTHVYTYAPFDTTFFDFPFTEATLTNGSFNGALGAAVNLPGDFKIYYNLSTGFRAPNVDDIGRVFDSQPGSVVVPNPNLKPETAYTAELGYTGRIAERVYVDFAAYYTILDNAIVRSTFQFNGQDSIDYDGTLSQVLALQNINEVRVFGTQISFRWDLTRNLRLESDLNIQRGEEKDPVTGNVYSPTHVPPTFGSTRLSYRASKWSAMLYANYNGTIRSENLALTERADAHLYAKDAEGKPYSPSWTTWNVKGSFSPLGFLTVDVGVENIFDIRYRPYSSGISAPGRNLVIALRARI